MADASTMDINPGHPAYYLNSKYGYYINFPSATTPYVSKGITSPMLLGGVLFYSIFFPTSMDVCSGGSGETDTYLVGNAMLPVVNFGNASSATLINGMQSGKVLVWTGVASRLSARSITTGIQAGMSSAPGTADDTSSKNQNLLLQNLIGNSSFMYANPRVWRTVH
jgi:hypothetical protein